MAREELCVWELEPPLRPQPRLQARALLATGPATLRARLLQQTRQQPPESQPDSQGVYTTHTHLSHQVPENHNTEER